MQLLPIMSIWIHTSHLLYSYLVRTKRDEQLVMDQVHIPEIWVVAQPASLKLKAPSFVAAWLSGSLGRKPF